MLDYQINESISDAYRKMCMAAVMESEENAENDFSDDSDDGETYYIGRNDEYYSEEPDDSMYVKPMWTWDTTPDSKDFAAEGPVYKLTEEGKRDFLEWSDAQSVGYDLCYGRMKNGRNETYEEEWERLTGPGMSKMIRGGANEPEGSDDVGGHWIVAKFAENGVPLPSRSANGANGSDFAEFDSFEEMRKYVENLITKGVIVMVKKVDDDGNEEMVDIEDVTESPELRDRYYDIMNDLWYGRMPVSHEVSHSVAGTNESVEDSSDISLVPRFTDEELYSLDADRAAQLMSFLADVSSGHTVYAAEDSDSDPVPMKPTAADIKGAIELYERCFDMWKRHQSEALG